MGNVLRSLYRQSEHSAEGDSGSIGPHGVSASTVGVSALDRDLFNFEITSQVPAGLSSHVVASRKAQANWYGKLLEAWKEAKPPPRTPEEASRLIINTLKGMKLPLVLISQGLLAFYGLPLPHAFVETSVEFPASLPHGVQFQFQTLPVDPKAVADGDTISVYVSTADPRESCSVPRDVQIAAVERSDARAVRDYARADALHQTIINSGYRVIHLQNGEEVLARKYRIRLRGIDAPEGLMPHGKEATEELRSIVQGKMLTVLAYGQDQYGRCVGDVYCNGIFVQEMMLKKGMAWHYVAYDQRAEFAKWEKEARAKRLGLWASRNPKEPWEWRKNKRDAT
ncbi:hypothetical protein CRG98_047815 [Punica granatum]|uniref:TNase-like domain-containing protein n=1 Tax=Punica granatum TaxID=22663 RepID=A0A2I0HJD2_PUNGR|nr:hypothetical protein CRG98_047815 [Punica granatum]